MSSADLNLTVYKSMTPCSLSVSHWHFFFFFFSANGRPSTLLRCVGTVPVCRTASERPRSQSNVIPPPKIAKTGNVWSAGSVVYPETAPTQVIKTLTGTSCVFAVPLKTTPFCIKHCLRFCVVVSGFTWTLCLLTWIRSRAMNMTGG